jgi:hypothetical protein
MYSAGKSRPYFGYDHFLGLRADVYREANEFCAEQNKGVETIKLDMIKTGFIWQERVDLQFRCK